MGETGRPVGSRERETDSGRCGRSRRWSGEAGKTANGSDVGEWDRRGESEQHRARNGSRQRQQCTMEITPLWRWNAGGALAHVGGVTAEHQTGAADSSRVGADEPLRQCDVAVGEFVRRTQWRCGPAHLRVLRRAVRARAGVDRDVSTRTNGPTDPPRHHHGERSVAAHLPQLRHRRMHRTTPRRRLYPDGQGVHRAGQRGARSECGYAGALRPIGAHTDGGILTVAERERVSGLHPVPAVPERSHTAGFARRGDARPLHPLDCPRQPQCQTSHRQARL
eukprot:ctg_172.g101